MREEARTYIVQAQSVVPIYNILRFVVYVNHTNFIITCAPKNQQTKTKPTYISNPART